MGRTVGTGTLARAFLSGGGPRAEPPGHPSTIIALSRDNGVCSGLGTGMGTDGTHTHRTDMESPVHSGGTHSHTHKHA